MFGDSELVIRAFHCDRVVSASGIRCDALTGVIFGPLALRVLAVFTVSGKKFTYPDLWVSTKCPFFCLSYIS